MKKNIIFLTLFLTLIVLSFSSPPLVIATNWDEEAGEHDRPSSSWRSWCCCCRSSRISYKRVENKDLGQPLLHMAPLSAKEEDADLMGKSMVDYEQDVVRMTQQPKQRACWKWWPF